jgi:serine/threonine protein kinase
MSPDARGPTSGTLVGQRFGRFRVLELLGEGGMGRVYRAQTDDGECVALKVIRTELARDEGLRRRFVREARAAARVVHPHVVPFVDAGEVDGTPFLAQLYVEGGTLDERITSTGTLPIDEIVRLALQVAGGLDALHAAGLVHRDLKPQNILLAGDSAYVADLGLAKDSGASLLTRAGQAIGSLDYMAPEQIRGEEVAGTTDVYALGCVVWTCLRGRPPFSDRRGMQVLWAHLHDTPADPGTDRSDVPDELGWAVLQALEKEPRRRPQTATAFARLVQMAARPEPRRTG